MSDHTTDSEHRLIIRGLRVAPAAKPCRGDRGRFGHPDNFKAKGTIELGALQIV